MGNADWNRTMKNIVALILVCLLVCIVYFINTDRIQNYFSSPNKNTVNKIRAEILNKLPSNIGTFHAEKVSEYSRSTLGAGRTYKYDDQSDTTILVYLYSMREDDTIGNITDEGIDDPLALQAFKEAIVINRLLERMGKYSNISVLSNGAISYQINENESLACYKYDFTFKIEGNYRRIIFILTGLRSNILQVHVSTTQNWSKENNTALNDFVKTIINALRDRV